MGCFTGSYRLPLPYLGYPAAEWRGQDSNLH
jgi:hypothetical protein